MTFSVLTRLRTLRYQLAAVLLVTLSFGLQANSDPSRIDIVAKRFDFAPNDITLKKGVPTVLVFHSEDVQHSIVVKDLNVKADIRKNKDTEVQVAPQTSGTFVGNCGHFCGSGHGHMKLTIHVVD